MLIGKSSWQSDFGKLSEMWCEVVYRDVGRQSVVWGGCLGGIRRLSGRCGKAV